MSILLLIQAQTKQKLLQLHDFYGNTCSQGFKFLPMLGDMGGIYRSARCLTPIPAVSAASRGPCEAAACSCSRGGLVWLQRAHMGLTRLRRVAGASRSRGGLTQGRRRPSSGSHGALRPRAVFAGVVRPLAASAELERGCGGTIGIEILIKTYG